MGHEYGHGFDQSVCEGCPHKMEALDDTGHPLIDRIVGGYARVTMQEVDRCGLCGCPLSNLERFSSPPSDCPRLDDHACR